MVGSWYIAATKTSKTFADYAVFSFSYLFAYGTPVTYGNMVKTDTSGIVHNFSAYQTCPTLSEDAESINLQPLILLLTYFYCR